MSPNESITYITHNFKINLFKSFAIIKVLTVSSVIISAQIQQHPCARRMDVQRQSSYRLPAAPLRTAIPDGP